LTPFSHTEKVTEKAATATEIQKSAEIDTDPTESEFTKSPKIHPPKEMLPNSVEHLVPITNTKLNCTEQTIHPNNGASEYCSMESTLSSMLGTLLLPIPFLMKVFVKAPVALFQSCLR
jgi:hypothetical protein